MARFIPDNALIYFEQRYGSRMVKEFTKSPLGKKFESINFFETSKKIGLPPHFLSTLENMFSFYALAKNNKLFHEIFGKRFALTILPPVDTIQYTDIRNNFV